MTPPSSIALLIAACIACGGDRPSATPPDPDTSGYEEPVAAKIRSEREAVLSEPGSADAWGRLGMTFDAHHMVHEAASCYAEAERLDPENWRWPYFLAVVRFDAPSKDVFESLLRAHAIEPDMAPLNVRIGLVLLRLDRSEEAERYFRRAHELAPRDADPLLGLARVALRLGDPAAALVDLDNAEELSPRHREVHVLLVRAYQELGEIEKARESAARAARLVGNTPIVDPTGREIFEHGASSFHLGERGHELLQSGQYAEAIEKLRASIDLNPKDADVHADLGRALVLTGAEEQGRGELEQANRIRPGSVDVAAELESLRHPASDD